MQALQSNLEIQSKRLDPAIDEDRIKGAWGTFDPAVTFSALHEEDEKALNQRDFLGTGQISRLYFEANDRYQAAIGGRLPTGTTYQLVADHARLNNTYNRKATSLFHPEYQSSTVLSVTQPLLKDFGFKANLAEIRLAKNAKRVSEFEFRGQVLQVISRTMAAYFEAVFAQENIRVKEQAITLAENLLHENRRRADEGKMASIDVIQAQARVAEAREELILAQSLLAQRRNTIKELTKDEFVFDSPDLVFSIDDVQLPEPDLDRDAIIQTTFAKNPAYLGAVEGAKAEDIRLAYVKNQQWPRVDLKATFGYNGLARDTERSFKDFGERTQPDWSAGVMVSMPIFNRAAKSKVSEAKKRQIQAAFNVKHVEVSLLSSVDTALRDIAAARQRVELVKDSTKLAETALEAEEKRLVSGLTTSYNVLSLQKELSQARSRELATLVDLNKAVTTLFFTEGILAEKMNILIKN